MSHQVFDELVSLGYFRNEHSELFVVLQMRISGELLITGDETAWQPVSLDQTTFYLSPEEWRKVKKILKAQTVDNDNPLKLKSNQ